MSGSGFSEDLLRALRNCESPFVIYSQEATKKCGYYYIEPNSDREKENDGQQKCHFYILNFCN